MCSLFEDVCVEVELLSRMLSRVLVLLWLWVRLGKMSVGWESE